MNVTLESTTKIITVGGLSARVWEGKSDSGIEVTALIFRLAINNESDSSAFDRELEQCRAPKPDTYLWPDKIIL